MFSLFIQIFHYHSPNYHQKKSYYLNCFLSCEFVENARIIIVIRAFCFIFFCPLLVLILLSIRASWNIPCQDNRHCRHISALLDPEAREMNQWIDGHCTSTRNCMQIPRTPVNSCRWGRDTVTPTRQWRQENPSGLVAHESSQFVSTRFSQRLFQKRRWRAVKTPDMNLCGHYHAHVDSLHIHTYTIHMCTHALTIKRSVCVSIQVQQQIVFDTVWVWFCFWWK